MTKPLKSNIKKFTRIELDPTKQAGTRRRAMANIRRKLLGAKREVQALVKSLPATLVTNRTEYIYELDDIRMQTVDIRIREIINKWFETQTDGRPARFFMNPYISASYSMGTEDSVVRTAMLAGQAGYSTADISQLEVEQIFKSGIYERRVALVFGRTFNEMKGFSGDTATDLARVLSQVVTDGDSPRVAQKLIAQRFNVADSRAERISRTEINRAYTVSRAEQADDTSKRLGIDVRMIHRSSLLPTTRVKHAARHGTVHTIQDQNDWWSTNGNRINCYCSTSEVVYSKDGKPFDGGSITKMLEQKKGWAQA
jgi:hypothetical protein